MTFTMYLILGLVAAGGGLSLLWRLSVNKSKRIESELNQEIMLRRHADADNEALIKYLAEKETLKQIHSQDLTAFQEAENGEKHTIVGNILDRLYGMPDG